MEPRGSVQSAYRPEIDGLRALAVVAVAVNHTNRDWIPSGYLGVDIFFVISGFVITASLAARAETSFVDFITSFYVRRVKRLVPALIFFVVVVGLLICLFDASPKRTLRTGITSLFGFSNLYLLQRSTDYFADATNLNVFAHTWSLGVEEQFYLFFPLLFWFAGRAIGDLGKLVWVTVALSAASLLAFAFLYRIDQPMAYFLMPTRFWELGAGCSLFLLLNHSGQDWNFLKKTPALPMLVGLIATLFLPQEWAVTATIATVVFTAATIATLGEGGYAYAILTQRPVVYVGLLSYSLYLWHWGILSLCRWTIGVQLWNVPFLFLIMLLMAAFSYHFIEDPLRRAQWSVVRSRSIAYGFVALIAASAVLFAVSKPYYGRLYLGRLLGVEVPSHLHVTWWRNYRTGEFLERCHYNKAFSAALMEDCLKIPKGEGRVAYLIGDSHARNYLPAVRQVFGAPSTVYHTMGHGCAFLPIEFAARYSKVTCEDYVTKTAAFLSRNVRPGDVIFIGQRLFERPERQGQRYVNFIKAFAARIKSRGARVVLLDGTFPPALRPEECVDLPWRPFGIGEGCHVDQDDVQTAFAEFDRLAFAAAEKNANLFYAPLRLGLCQGQTCGQTTVNGTPVWHDRGHITEKASAELGPYLRRQLDRQRFFGAATN